MTQSSDGEYPVFGVDLANMLSAGAARIERELPTLNQLNVFPVPDADTGTNMLHTVRRASRELDGVIGSTRPSVDRVAALFARGAFSGARGNSGVILSQILNGFAQAIDGIANLDAGTLIAALRRASDVAYESVSQPVEGTMLTVIRDAADAVAALPQQRDITVYSVLSEATRAAHRSVERTPDLLPVLKEHGVVDAGALGVALFLEGMKNWLGKSCGAPADAEWVPEPDEGAVSERASEPASRPAQHPEDSALEEAPGEAFGYCTEFLISATTASVADVQSVFGALGGSLVVAQTGQTIRVHVHTHDPGAALTAGLRLGVLHDISIRNMDDQHNERVRDERGDHGSTRPAAELQPLGVLAFATGGGFAAVFESLGATVFEIAAEGSEDLTPIVRQAVLEVPAHTVILVPGSEDVFRAAATIDPGDRVVHVVGALEPASAMAAVMAFTYGASAEQNVARMEKAASAVTTISVSDGQLPGDAVREAGLGRHPPAELVTLYFGRAVEPRQAEQAAREVAEALGVAGCEAIYGGQDNCAYLVSIE